MPDSNGDPTQNQPPVPNKPGSEGSLPSNLTRAPRTNPPNVGSQKEPPTAAAVPPGFAEFMTWMQSMGTGTGTAEEEAKAGRNLIPKEQKKFSRRGAESVKTAVTPPEGEAVPGKPVAASTSTESTGEVNDRSTIAPPLRNLPPDLLTAERKRRSKEGSKGGTAALLMQILVFGLIVGSFFLGRATVPKGSTPTPLTAPAAPVTSANGQTAGLLPPELAAKVNEATAAEAEEQPQKAFDLLQSVKNAGGHVVGLNYHLALLAYGSGQFERVLPLVNQSIAEGEEVAACYNLRGTLSNRQGGVNAGLQDLVMATKIDPFSAHNAFFAGEAMRRQGKTQAAVTFLTQALNCLHEPLLESFYQLKLRLAQIEMGQEKEFTDEMAKQLALTPPSVDWLFTAAALEMRRGNFAAAAAQLDKAKSLATEREMAIRLRDYYFYGFAEQKELARFYEPLKRAIAPPAGAAAPNAPFSTDNPFERKTSAPRDQKPASMPASPSPTPTAPASPAATPLLDVPTGGNLPKLP